MAWVRTKAIITELSPAPNLIGWLIVGALIIVVAVLIFILHASGSFKPLTVLNIWLVSLTLPLCWFIAFCARYWLRQREIDKHLFLQHEAERGQQQWEQWAQRYIAVLGSSIQLPDGITAAAVLESSPDAFPSRGSLARRIEGVQSPLKSCLLGVQSELKSLPPTLPLRISVLTDSDPVQLNEEFPDVWASVFPELIAPVDVVISETLSMAHLEERLKQPTMTVDLIIVMQLHGEKFYSDGLATLLLTSDDVAEKYQLSHATRLLRPMPLAMAMFEQDFILFLETQTTACLTSRVVADVLDWEKVSASLMSTGGQFDAKWQPAERLNLEKITGIPGKGSPWLLIALTADLVSLRKESLLTLFSSGTEQYISTHTTGREYEQTG
ncbi:type VI secretion protein [Pantoea sp. PNT02]|jgi:hypothetical protein|uniref:type VI secretion protein n=1 Tax=Pantoea sp. PNT02 TaxID=2769261 RepID=UPI00177DFD37|nr:type VI secretion protein [Pantoea sp. PNT02]MBD9642637.1 type VI secretion protein [Pantoea sp. PNT02]